MDFLLSSFELAVLQNILHKFWWNLSQYLGFYYTSYRGYAISLHIMSRLNAAMNVQLMWSTYPVFIVEIHEDCKVSQMVTLANGHCRVASDHPAAIWWPTTSILYAEKSNEKFSNCIIIIISRSRTTAGQRPLTSFSNIINMRQIFELIKYAESLNKKLGNITIRCQNRALFFQILHKGRMTYLQEFVFGITNVSLSNNHRIMF